MGVMDTFYFLFEADTTKLKTGVDEAKKKVSGVSEEATKADANMAKMGESFVSLAKKAAGLIGVGFSIKEIVQGVQETAEAYFQLEKLATQFRTTADAVDEFADAGQLIGLSQDQTVGGLKALDSAIQDTALGMGRAKMVFEELGITIKDASGKIKPTTAVMAELQEKFKSMEKGTQMRVMERLGLDPALLKLFNTDMGELQARMSKIDEAAGFNFDDAIKSSADFTKATKAMWLEIRTIGMFFEKLRERMNVSFMDTFIKGMNLASDILRRFFNFLLDHKNFAQGFFIAIAAAISYFLIPMAISGAIAVWAMIAPFVAVGAAVVAVGLAFAALYDDVMNFLEGNNSMIGEISKSYPIVGEIVKDMANTFQFLWDVVKAVFNLMVDAIFAPQQAFDNFFKSISDAIENLKNMFPDLLKSFTDVGRAIADTELFKLFKFAKDKVVSVAQGAMDFANNVPINGVSSNAISNSRSAENNATVTIGKVEVQTQATDSEGISKSIGANMQSQIKQATSNFDDGIAG